MKRLLAVAILLLAAGPASAQLEGLTNPFSRRRSAGAFPAAVVSTRPHPAVCRIIVPNSDGTSFGTGTLVDARGKHGLVLTNWHVVNEASGPIEVVFPDGFRTPGHVHKVDKDWDLAALAIYRPSAAPVNLSQQVPREGDALTIAGYGQGDYRAVTGRCLQFLAPSDNQPFEIIELGAAARQGDSGGPIFNTRGELAGVLFGEGDGRTCGSHCGRVNRFLAGVLPGTRTQSDALLAARPPTASTGMHTAAAGSVHEEPLEPVGGSSLGGGISAVAASTAAAAPPIEASASPLPPTGSGDPLNSSGEYATAGVAPAPAAVISPPGDNNWAFPAAASPTASPPAPIESAPPPGAMVQTPEPAAATPASAAAISAESRPGPAWLNSPAVEITKNVLAGVGVLAIFGHLLRAIFARKPAAA